MDKISAYIRQTYEDLLQERTLKWGKIAAICCFIMILVFVSTDYTSLFKEFGIPFSALFPWRLMGLLPFLAFAIGSITFLKRKKSWIIPMYTLCMIGSILMMCGLTFYILGMYPQLKVIAFGTTMGFITTLFVLSLISFGARRYLSFIIIGGVVALISLLVAYGVRDTPNLATIFAVALFVVLQLLVREKLEYSKHSHMIKLEKKDEELQAKQKELVKANKDLESFNYTVSHDLRTPLANAVGYQKLLHKKLTKAQETAMLKWVDYIGTYHTKMDRLIKEILSFSRMGHQRLQKREVNMERLAKEVFKDERTYLELDQKPITFCVGELPQVFVDKLLISQVLGNLFSNALKYSSQNEEIKITMDVTEEPGRYIFSLQDNGIGFSETGAQKLFSDYSRLENGIKFDGNGIGLAFVKRIIEAHGGGVWATGTEGEGATFYFSLPQEPQPVESPVSKVSTQAATV